MKHIEMIQAFIKTLTNSNSFHALVIQSPPGFGKSTTIDLAFVKLGIQAVTVGSYATPLHIYNLFCRHPDAIIVIDDCAGLFHDVKTMAILKAATWKSSGHGAAAQEVRRVAWGSTSEKVEQPFVDFSGKIILLTNVLPCGKETEAFLSRSLTYRISMNRDDVKQMLLTASQSSQYFSKTELAQTVAGFLIEATAVDLMKVNLRTLKMGYDLAVTHPDSWRELFLHLLPRSEVPPDLISGILRSGLAVREQEARFLAITGKSRRSYYNLKKRLGLSRRYRTYVPARRTEKG